MKLRRLIAVLSVCSLGALTGCPQAGDFGRNANDNAARDAGDRLRPDADLAPGQGGDDAPPRNNPADKPGQPANDPPDVPLQDRPQPANVPAELTGYWRTILTYLPGHYTWIIDPGDFSGSIGATYYFGADGQYKYDLNTASAYFGGMCFKSSSWTEWGAFSVTGAELVLKPARATNVGSDTCGEWVLDDNAPTKDSAFTFTTGQDATGAPTLRLRFPSGEEVLFERCRDCE